MQSRQATEWRATINQESKKHNLSSVFFGRLPRLLLTRGFQSRNNLVLIVFTYSGGVHFPEDQIMNTEYYWPR